MAAQIYETVAAGQTDQVIGTSGQAGDLLDFLLVVPATLSPGTVSIKDGSGANITVFVGGAGSVSNLIPFAVPFAVPLAARAANGPWKVTTGANVSVIAVGIFN